jgi:uncharacterized protein (DUF1501 family)
MQAPAGALTLGGPLALQRALAAKDTKRRFIFAYFEGGWDQLIALDPRDPAVFTEAKVGQTQIQPAFDLLPAGSRNLVAPNGSRITFGPAAQAFARHYDKCCVVRGVAMDTVTHIVGRRYFLTGLPPRGRTARGSSMGTRVVAQQGDHAQLPNLVMRVETYNDGLPNYANGVSLSNVTDLISTFRPGPQALDDQLRGLLADYRAKTASCDPVALNHHGQLLTSARQSQAKAHKMLAQDLGQHFDFQQNAALTALKQRYAIGEGGAAMAQPGAQAAMALQAIKHGVAQSVTVRLAAGLDTHGSEWASAQIARQRVGWQALATLVDDLAREKDASGATLLSNTTVVVFSEFARTPKLNNNNGRDHHLASSTLLIGAGVPHNKVVGATSNKGMNPLSIDPTTGAVKSGGTRLNPTLVLASVMESAGLDTSELRTTGLPCLMA